ncbi:MAG: class I SAM-dependent methyltransferase, partial [Nanoarchaeota archaeon]|nr:class I SAM-dependent methyltransferase [Nanoarchaeota archaeon]
MAKEISNGVNQNPYLTKNYNHRARWITYYIQWRTISDILAPGSKILEVGAGSKVVSWWLKNLGYEVITVDNNPDIEPDVVADISSLPFEDNAFDLVLAAEILEHLDFNEAMT